MDAQSAKLIAAALALIPLFAVALGLGNLFSSIINAIGRNPSVADTVKGAGLIYFALIEAVALFALVISLLILFMF
jgi:F-type H+-transporting ATPase subunit c